MPNKDRIKLLVDALRSGDYTQTTGVLEKKTESNKISNCCLGVACRVAMLNGLELGLGTFDSNSEDITTFEGVNDVLPDKVRDWYDFEYTSPHVTDASGYPTTAIALNDNEKLNFVEIADAFERTYLIETDVRTIANTNNMLSSDDV